jgi:hypothetical protein
MSTSDNSAKPALTEAVKHGKDEQKPRMSLIPPHAQAMVGRVMGYGARKYEAWNYLMGKGLPLSEYLDAIGRHTNAFIAGEENDVVSGLHHMAHAAASAMIVFEMQLMHPEQDDRFTFRKGRKEPEYGSVERAEQARLEVEKVEEGKHHHRLMQELEMLRGLRQRAVSLKNRYGMARDGDVENGMARDGDVTVSGLNVLWSELDALERRYPTDGKVRKQDAG